MGLHTCVFLSGLDHCVQQIQFLLWRTVQFLNVPVDQICVDTGHPPRQLRSALLGVGILDSHMNWSAGSDAATSLNGPVYASGLVRYHPSAVERIRPGSTVF